MKRWRNLGIIALAVIVVDQITKEWIIRNILPYDVRYPIPALEDYFRLTHTYNTGAAFGVLPTAGDLFLVLAVVIVLGLLFFYRRIPDAGSITRIGVALVIGGALGNVIDRLNHGHVTDFINYTVPGAFSNVSNLADHAIVLGVILIVIDSFRLERLEKAQAEAQSTEPEVTDSSSPDN